MASVIRRLADAVAQAVKPAKGESAPVESVVQETTAKADMGPRIGSHGQEYTSGIFREEYHADLAEYANRVDRLNELRVGDSVIAAQLLRLETPIAQARWTFEPAPEDEPLPSEKAAQEALEPEDDAEEPEDDAKPEKPRMLADGAPAPPIAPADRKPAPPPSPEDLAAADATERTLRVLRANLLGQGPSEYRMRQPWRQFLHEAQTARAFGFSIFERTYRRAKGGPFGDAIVVDGLWWMHPRSIARWHIDRDGDLLGIVQRWPVSSYEGDGLDAKQKTEWTERYIPASRLVVFTRHKEGAHVEGVGTIRHVYADAKHAAFLRKAIRIDASKRAIGIPRVTITSDAPPQVKDLAVQQAKRMRMGDERLFVVDTPGVTTGFVDMAAGVLDVSDHMRGAEDRIRMAHATEWAALGSAGSGGSYSAGDIQSRYFNLVLEADAEWLRETIQQQVVEPLAAINTSGAAPMLRCFDVSPRELTPILEAKKAALLTWTAEDEQDLRRQLRLRQLTEDELAARAEKKAMGEALAAMAVGADPEEAKQGGKSDDAKGAKPAAPAPAIAPPKELAAGPKVKRQPTEWESRYYAMQDIEEARDAAIRDLVQLLKPLRAAAVREAVSKATINGTRISVPRLKRKPLEDAMTRILERVREAGRESVREEIRRQVADLKSPNVSLAAPPPPFDPTKTPRRALVRAASKVDVGALVAEINEEMNVLTTLNVERLLDSIKASVSRNLLNYLSQGMPEDEARAAAQRDSLEGGDAQLEGMAREGVNRGIVNGRAEVAAQAQDALEEQGLRLEVATRTHVGEDEPCEECVVLDGFSAPVGSADYYANMPPAKCLGGNYCHCEYVYTVERAES